MSKKGGELNEGFGDYGSVGVRRKEAKREKGGEDMLVSIILSDMSEFLSYICFFFLRRRGLSEVRDCLGGEKIGKQKDAVGRLCWLELELNSRTKAGRFGFSSGSLTPCQSRGRLTADFKKILLLTAEVLQGSGPVFTRNKFLIWFFK